MEAHRSESNPDPDPAQPAPPSPPAMVRYRECLKNHAAGMGTHVVDGCGEFMANGEESTPEGLKCAACDCHQSFHRQEVVAFGGAPAEYSGEDCNMLRHTVAQPSEKRFRTKFTEEQKEMMHDFAERIGWRIQKQDKQEIRQFCSEVGLTKQVFKVWMHNSKQAMKKKQS